MADINDLLIRIDATTETLRRELRRAESSTAQTAKRMDRSLKQVDRSLVRTGRGSGFRAMKGSLQQVGFQVGDFATQIASGQSALVAFTQQGSQMAGAFGPGGAVAGAILAIGGAVAGAFFRDMMGGAKATDALTASLERLDAVIDEQDGIKTLTDDIRKLAEVSEVAAKARIVSAMAAAEEAARNAARGIRDAFEEIAGRDVLAGGNFRATRQILRDLESGLGLEGGGATAATQQIIDALERLDANPTLENFRNLESVIAETSTTLGENSEVMQTLVADLSQFFRGAGNAAEGAKRLQQALQDLAAGRDISLTVEEINTKGFPERRDQIGKRKKTISLDDEFINQALGKQREADRILQSTRTELEQIEAQIARVQELTAGGFINAADSEETIRRLREQMASLDNEFDDIARSIATNFTGAFDEMFTSGELSLESFTNAVLRDLARITAQLFIMKPLVEGLFGAGGGDSQFGQALFSAFGFAKGGSFTVGGSGGPDSQLVPLRLSPGEHVRVTPPGQSGPGESFTVVVNQTVGDVASTAQAAEIADRTAKVVMRQYDESRRRARLR